MLQQWYEGFNAGYNRMYEDSCPYPGNTQNYYTWMEGYHYGQEAQYLDEWYPIPTEEELSNANEETKLQEGKRVSQEER